MLALLLLAATRQSDISAEMEQALAGKPLAGSAFHHAIDPILEKYGALQTVKFQRTVGDDRGLMMTLAGSGPNWDGMKAWRIFLWPENQNVRAQIVKRYGDYSTSATDFFTDGEVYWRIDKLIIAGHDYDGSASSRAGLTYLLLEGGHWKMAQHVASERQGEASFVRNDHAVDPSRILVRTRLRPDNFHVSAEGPMLTFTQTWQVKGGQYVKGQAVQDDTAVTFLDRLAGFARKNDRKGFDGQVADHYRDVLWRCFSDPKLTIVQDAMDDDGSVLFDIADTSFIIGIAKVGGNWFVSKLIQR